MQPVATDKKIVVTLELPHFKCMLIVELVLLLTDQNSAMKQLYMKQS